jgi:glycosyltransferase involved in cell wall biosynthesis
MPIPLVVTVQDLTMRASASSYSRFQRLYYGGSLKSLVRKASTIIAPSRATAEELLDWRPRARVRVIPNPLRPMFLSPRLPNPHDLPALADGYLLYTGGFHHRKDLPTLFGGVGNAQRETLNGLTLAVTGQPTWEARQLAMRFGCTVEWLGLVPEDQLPPLYAGADAVVSASSLEGFAYPAAEARATGRPFVCPEEGPSKETAGVAAVTFLGGDPDALAEAVASGIAFGRERRVELERDAERARQELSIETAAERLIRCYDEVLNG